MKNMDVPGVIGHVGNVLGKNQVNIANFSLGRRESQTGTGPQEAIAVVATDTAPGEGVLQELMQNPAVTLARAVELDQ